MILKDLIDGYSKEDILKIISIIDKRINISTHIKDITRIKFIEKDKSSTTGWIKPDHYLVSYTWQGDSEYGYVKDGIGGCEIYDLKRQMRELKLNQLLNEL